MSGQPAMPPALYIPSTSQLPSYSSTDDYLLKTDYVYHVGSERLLTVGNPYFEIRSTDKQKVVVPKVSGNQYRVFRLKLPDPNGLFPLPSGGISDPDNNRLVWQLVAVQVTRGGPLNVGLSGAPLFNRDRDVETASKAQAETGSRVNVAFDPKQNQMFICGCTPPTGQHWSEAKKCDVTDPETKCPPLELVNTVLEDGDMSDIGFGAMDFRRLGLNRSDVPLELTGQISKYPDWIRMRTDPHGDSCFFLVKREQVYCRRLWQHAGGVGEKVPDSIYIGSAEANTNNTAYLTVPSGSVLTTDTQLFDRPYWLTQAQGPNNGVLWNQNLFVTVLDNTRNTIMHITTVAEGKEGAEPTKYDSVNYNEYSRHCEEFEITALIRLCKVPLTTSVLSHIYRIDPSILERWGISEAPSASLRTEDKYRYLDSAATRCPLQPPPPSPTGDPYDGMHFWVIDCSDRVSLDLSMHPLGRKYLALPQVRRLRVPRPPGTRKRPLPASSSETSRVVTRSKRRRR